MRWASPVTTWALSSDVISVASMASLPTTTPSSHGESAWTWKMRTSNPWRKWWKTNENHGIWAMFLEIVVNMMINCDELCNYGLEQFYCMVYYDGVTMGQIESVMSVQPCSATFIWAHLAHLEWLTHIRLVYQVPVGNILELSGFINGSSWVICDQTLPALELF